MGRHWITPVTATSAPRTLLALAYDPLDHSTGGRGYLTRAGGWSTALAFRDGSRWIDQGLRHFAPDQLPEMWSHVDDVGRQRGRVYVVCRCASDCLTLSGFWDRVDAGEVSLRLEADSYKDRDGKARKRKPHPLILSGVPDVIGWSVGRAEYKAVSLGNHLSIPILACAQAAGYPDPPESRWCYRPTGHADPDSAWTAGALVTIYSRMLDWWLAVGGGRWADTIGAAAWQMWRTTLGENEVLEHDQPSATAMERAAVYGGRAQLFWFGSAGSDGDSPADEAYLEPAVPIHMPGRIHKLDVRSMYASLMAEREYPTRLAHRLRPRHVKDLLAASRRWCLVATVRVRTTGGAVPYHDDHAGVTFPAGEWWTTLATPELLACIRRGELVEVGEAWAYHRGKPLSAFAGRLVQQRQDASGRGDKIGENMCKSLANALGGRLARTFRGWTTIAGKFPRQPWGEWAETDADSGEVGRYRGVAGTLQQFVTRDERAGGLTAIYAHLTAYGRAELRRLMDVAGSGNVLWCDTDGMIVTDDGLSALQTAGEIHNGTPGKLRYVEEVRSFSGRTPKHYRTERGWTLSGARGDFSPVDRHKVRCYLTANPVRSGQKPSGSGLPTVAPIYHLDAIPLSGIPGPDGWLAVPTVKNGTLHQPEIVRDHGDAELHG